MRSPRTTGKKASIKRLRVEANHLDHISEAYIDALGQLIAEEPAVTLFGRPVASHDEAILALHDELERQVLDPADLLRVMKRKRQQATPELV